MTQFHHNGIQHNLQLQIVLHTCLYVNICLVSQREIIQKANKTPGFYIIHLVLRKDTTRCWSSWFQVSSLSSVYQTENETRCQRERWIPEDTIYYWCISTWLPVKALVIALAGKVFFFTHFGVITVILGTWGDSSAVGLKTSQNVP